MDIRTKVKGVADFQDAMNAIAIRMQRPSPFLRAGGLLMLESVQRNFIEGGRPEKWESLKPETIRRRGGGNRRKWTAGGGWQLAPSKAGWGDAQILRDRGFLMNSIAPHEVTDKSISIGTNDPKAPSHHYGATSGRSHTIVVPARPFLMLQAEDKIKLLQMAGEFVVKGKE